MLFNSTIVFAAQDTTSSALVKLLSVLSERQGAQNRLREEIRNARRGKTPDEEWSYDELNELPFLDAVCRETLRLYPPTSWFWRT
jgi:cytochrome P450